MAGRPPILNEELINLAKEYRDNWNTIFEGDVVPTIEGLALHVGIHRDTIYDWVGQENKDDMKTRFSDIVKETFQKQGKLLVNKGLEGKFAPKIAGILLSKHDYREAKEVTGKDGKDLIPPTMTEEDKVKLNALLNGNQTSTG